MENDFPRMAGGALFRNRLLRAFPFIGDAYAAYSEATDVEGEPDPVQRMINAAVVGGGGMLVSGVTGGWDLVPQVAEMMGDYAAERENEGYIVPDWPIGTEFTKVSPLINPDNLLRLVAYGGKHEPTLRKMERAAKELPTPRHQPTFYYPF